MSNQTLLIYRVDGGNLVLDSTMTMPSGHNYEVTFKPVAAPQGATPIPITSPGSLFLGAAMGNATPPPIARPQGVDLAALQEGNQRRLDAAVAEAKRHSDQLTADIMRGVATAQAAIDTPGFNPETAVLPPNMEVVADHPNGGKRVVFKPTATDIRVGEWVTELVVENPIPGTDELRAEFFQEEAAMKARHEQDGTKCKPCETGTLIRKYRAKLEQLGKI